jgi:predicted ester cyclase
MTEQEKDFGRRWFEEVWNKGRREAIAEMVRPDALFHEGNADILGPTGFYPFFDRIHGTLSAIRAEVKDSFAYDDKLCVRWSLTGTHTGDGLGLPPTGVTINVTGISIVRIADGKLIESWQNWDMLGMMTQIQGSSKAGTYLSGSSGPALSTQ